MTPITSVTRMLIIWGTGLFCVASCGLDAEPASPEARSFPTSDGSADPCRVAMAVETGTIEDFEHGLATRWWINYDDTAEELHEPSSDDCGRLSEMADDACFVERRPEEVCDGARDLPEDYCYVRHWPGREPVATEMRGGAAVSAATLSGSSPRT